MHTLSNSFFKQLAAMLLTAALIFPTLAFAQTEELSIVPVTEQVYFEAEAEAEAEDTASYVIANINLSEAAILEQTPERLVLSFVLTNGDPTPHFDIRYGVELIENLESGGQVVADFSIADEVLTLSPNQTLSKVLEYPMAALAPGTYTVLITAQTSAGVMLGLGLAGEVTVSTSDALEIMADSCVLSVSGEEAGVSYDLYQGVDVADTEDLRLTCMMKNHGDGTRTAVPQYETFARTVYGDKFAMSYPTEAPINFAAGEEKSVTLTVPKANKPQAYDLVLELVDASTRLTASNKLMAHYVLQGVSATIQTVDFTKESYQAGEEIVLDLFWTGSADGFPDSRQGAGTEIGGAVSASVSIVDGDGVMCAPSVTQVLSGEITTVQAVATINCVSPQATLSLLGPDGTVLDTTSIAVPKAETTAEVPTTPTESRNTLMYVSILAFAVALIIILFVTARHRQEISSAE